MHILSFVAITHNLSSTTAIFRSAEQYKRISVVEKIMSTVEWQQRKLMPTRSSCHREPTHNIRQSAGQHATFVRERPCYITKSQDTQTLWKESRSRKRAQDNLLPKSLDVSGNLSRGFPHCAIRSQAPPGKIRPAKSTLGDSGKTTNKPDKHHKRSNIQDPPTLKCPTHPTQAKRTDHGQQPHSLAAGLEAAMYHTWPVV